MTLLALYLLASLDGLLCGCRAWMGRCALVHKQQYYVGALLYGFLGAQAVSLLALLALVLAVILSSDRNILRVDLLLTAARMLWIFLPYTVVVLLSLALRVVPSMDLRSATSVLSLGPLTALRPIIMIVGVVYGIWSSRLMETRILGVFVLALMLSLEFCLNILASRQQSAELCELI